LAAFPEQLDPGSDTELGAVVDANGTNFALFSANASRVQLCLVDPRTGAEIHGYDLPERSGDIWHGHLPGAGPGLHYHYRVDGPRAPNRGLLFDPTRPLLDPYARAWSHGFADFDSKGLPAGITTAALPGAAARHPPTAWQETVIYEAHVKGLTRRHRQIDPAIRGTYRALAAPALLEHLNRLGVTAVELLPIQAFVDEPFLRKKQLSNYWGYNPVGFFVAEPRYAAGDDALGEFRQAVDALHAAGIEVILDVVYNHTGEGDLNGRCVSFRGIDNASYYKLDGDGGYRNYSGCGNVLDLGRPAVQRLAMDSLRYWVEAAGIDGFRFDLASCLGRDGESFEAGSAFLDMLRQDPRLRRVKLIAEPWDIGPEGYRLGAFGHPFGEWNDRFRDIVRRFWRGDEGMLPGLAGALLGSADAFDRGGRRAWASVNMITSHDGFTAADLVSYERKHNWANREGNRDGHGHNHSWNHGSEGPSAHPSTIKARVRSIKNLLLTLVFAQGTPMLLAGDEHLNSQNGNNNAYCQDNDIGWLDWHDDDHRLGTFAASLMRLRQSHPELRQTRFLHGEPTGPDALANARWRHPTGRPMSEHDWHDPKAHALWLELEKAEGGHLSLLLNAGADECLFRDASGDVLAATDAARAEPGGIVLPAQSAALLDSPPPNR